MKTKFLNYILLSVFTLAFVSCQNDDEAVPPQSQAEFTASPSEVKVGQDIQFTNNSQNATAYLWSFGDGTTSNQVSPRKSYQSSDVFLVSLVSTGAGGSTISNIEVTVTPASAFSVADVDNLSAKSPVQFTNTSLGAASYSWSFGDANNSTSTEQNPSFAYPSAGTYTVSLTATSSAGSNTFTKEISIAAAPEVPGELYYIDLTDEFLRKLSLDGSGTVTDVVDLVGKGGVGITYDATNEKIYFSDFDTTPFGNIWRVNRDGTGLEVVITNIVDPYAIVLDVTGNKMYWIDDAGNVSRANLDGTSPEIGILNVPNASWRALALDVENGKMYAYDANIEDIYVVNLDGSNPQIIISDVYGYAIAIDTVNDKIYFDERNSGELQVANLDGTNIQTIDTSSSRIYGIYVDSASSKLYWSIRDTGGLYRADLNGSNKEVLKSGLGSVRGIVLIK